MGWQLRTLATGLGFPEGPVYLGDGALAFTDISEQCVWRYTDGRAQVLAKTGGGPNGAVLGPHGDLYIANNGGLNVGPNGYWFAPDPIDGRVQRVTMSGEVFDLTGELPGEGPHRPNDICIGPDGLLYFTDPANWEDFANLKPGRIWRASFDGKVELLTEVPMFPNGIGFGPDGALFVAQTLTQKVLRFVWSAGVLGDAEEFCTLPKGFPDGFCFAANGDLYVSGSMGDVICVFDADGALKEAVDFPEHSEPTNCCLGDGTLYITCSGTGELVATDLH